MSKIYTAILFFALVAGFAYKVQADEPIIPQLGATYDKLTDGTKNFSLSLSARIDDKRVNMADAALKVYAAGESGKTLLGTVNTNRTGKAVLNLAPAVSLPKDKEGYYTFEVHYAGNTKISSVVRTIRVQDVCLAMAFGEKDSTKHVAVKATMVNDKGVTTAVRDVPVEVYIKRLFCLYRFGGEKTDSAGRCEVDFPKNMPGDTTGNLVVVAKILENDTYGTVETVGNFAGGTRLVIEPKPRRGLGDTDAPLWMVYTLLVLLSGVWCHVIYVVSLVVRINIIGKKAASGA